MGKNHYHSRGSILWNTLDDSAKNEPTLSAFKKRIKNWAGHKCTCKITANLLLCILFIFFFVNSWFELVYLTYDCKIPNLNMD